MTEWNIHHYFKALWQRAWLILVVTLVATAVSFVVSRSMAPVYRATTTILTGEDNTNPQVKAEDYVLSQRLSTGYAALVTRQSVLQNVVQVLGLQVDWRTVRDNVLAAPVPNSSLVEIRVSDTDPRRAAAIANEIDHQLILNSATLTNQQDLQNRQGFIQSQLDQLQANIDGAKASIQQEQAALDVETSARAVADLKDQLKAQQAKVSDWQDQYQKLLGTMPQKSPNTITVVETASPPTKPVSPNLVFNLLLAGFAGLLLSSGVVVLMEYLSANKVRTFDEVGKLAAGPGLALITRMSMRGRQTPRLMALEDPQSPIAEQFRVLRSNIRFVWAGPEPMALLITSPGPGEGKSTISANLAASFAQAGKQTILIDADLRHPTLHSLFNVENQTGLTALLAGSAGSFKEGTPVDPDRLRYEVAEALVETTIPNLALLPAGPAVHTNPGELLAGPAITRLLELLQRSADVIIMDSPPLLAIADAQILATLPVGVVVVAESDHTAIKAIAFANQVLERAEARTLGFVLNKAVNAANPYYAYGYTQSRSRRSALRLLGRKA